MSIYKESFGEFDTSSEKIYYKLSEKLSKKLSRDEWNVIEQKMSHFELYVLNSLSEHAKAYIENKNVDVEKEIKKKVLGDYFYSLTRNDLVAKNIVSGDWYIEIVEDSKKKPSTLNKKKKKGFSAEEIKMKNIINRIEGMIKPIINDLNMDKFFPYSPLQSEIIEVIGIGYLYMLSYIDSHSNEYADDKYINALNVLISSQRFIEKCENYSGIDILTPGKYTTISKQLIVDMKKKYEIVEEKFPFDGLTIYNIAPQLLIWAEYDKFIPSFDIKPRKHQADIVSGIFNNFDNGVVMVYRAMIGSGKTTSLCGIASFVDWIKKTRNGYEDLQIIFCCNLQSVKIQVGQICYNADIKFGMASINNNNNEGKYIIKNSYNCRKDSDRVVIICSPEVACMILSDNNKGLTSDKYIIFHDEPTIGSDSMGSYSLSNNMKLLMNLPKWSILSSATFPQIEKLPKITDKLTKLYPKIRVIDITSNDIQIGCNLLDYDGNVCTPYNKCRNVNELREVIESIRAIPFLGKTMTSNIAMALWRKSNELGISNIPNVPVIFKSVGNMRAGNVRETVLEILEKVIEFGDNEMVKEICTMEINDGKNLDFKKMCTEDIWKYDSMTLIATCNPEQFALDNFTEILGELKKCGYSSATKIYAKYRKSTKQFQKKIEEILRNLKSTDNKDKPASEEEKSRKRQKLELDSPIVDFPDWGQIGTLEHIKKFSNKKRKNVANIRLVNDLSEIEIDEICAPDDFLILLLCGVGIYYPDSNLLPAIYRDIVLNMAFEGKLSFVIADNSISYGTNYPFGRVIVCKDFSEKYSVNTMFQLMGRAGRVGKSWKAEAFIPKEFGDKLISHVMGSNKNDIEVDNMRETMDKITKEEEYEVDKLIEKMENDIDIEFNDISDELSYSSGDETSVNNDVSDGIEHEHNECTNADEVPESWEDFKLD
jgi:hypothetical protein